VDFLDPYLLVFGYTLGLLPMVKKKSSYMKTKIILHVHFEYNQKHSLVTNYASKDRELLHSMHLCGFKFETDCNDNHVHKVYYLRVEIDFGKSPTKNFKDRLPDIDLDFR
jgi:hypothetical protein